MQSPLSDSLSSHRSMSLKVAGPMAVVPSATSHNFHCCICDFLAGPQEGSSCLVVAWSLETKFSSEAQEALLFDWRMERSAIWL